ncbi:TPA: hypothetical protein DEP21_05920 [Patescibacteria group bacterium]|nr:hypothetical protein [Candidatus Gracilibacteria bacterium]
MIKIILGNYILGILCLAANQSITILITFLESTPTLKALGFTYQDLATFLQNGKITIVLVLYILFLLLLYSKSKIRISLPDDEILKKSLYIILVPLCVTSIILTFEIVLMGINSIDTQSLQKLAFSLTTNDYLYQFITLTPLWILIHGVATVLITSEIKMNIKTDL